MSADVYHEIYRSEHSGKIYAVARLRQGDRVVGAAVIRPEQINEARDGRFIPTVGLEDLLDFRIREYPDPKFVRI